jgi:hypothetical protein
MALEESGAMGRLFDPATYPQWLIASANAQILS